MKKSFKVLTEKEEYRDGERFSVIRARLQTPINTIVNWAYLKAGDGVIVVAIKDNKVFIKKEWRLVRRGFLWELPSGWVGKIKPTQKDILVAANRELQEEVGMKAKKLKLLTSFYLMNHSTSKFHLVLAENLSVSKLDGDEHEYVDTKLVSFTEAETLLLKKQIPSAQVLIAINYLKTFTKKFSL